MKTKPIGIDDVARENGFDDFTDLVKCMGRVDFNNLEQTAIFKKWQYEDGTKAGLLKLFPEEILPK